MINAYEVGNSIYLRAPTLEDVDGKLYIQSRTAIKGYKNHDNSSFREDGRFATGDLVELDDEGFIKIIGRKNDVINVGGLKVPSLGG